MLEVDPKNIWVVGAYMNSMNWKTNLITQIEPEKRRNEVIKFFEGKLTEQKYIEEQKVWWKKYHDELFAVIQKDSDIWKYFDSAEILQKIVWKDGTLDWKEVTEHLSRQDPKKFNDSKEWIENYKKFHNKFQKLCDELIAKLTTERWRLEKELETNWISTVSDIVKLFWKDDKITCFCLIGDKNSGFTLDVLFLYD